MPKLIVTLKTVTPMFLAGADNRTPELRPASFRGALRFWLRALLGAHIGDDQVAMRNAESAVFGNTNGASPIVVRVSPRVPRADQLKLARGDRVYERRVLPHSRDKRKQFTKPAWAEDGQFTLTLATRLGLTELSAEAIAALLLLLNVGGVGNRSRRGFGSLQVVNAKTEGLSEDESVISLLDKSLTNGADLEKHLAGVLTWARKSVRSGGGRPYAGSQVPDYPILTDQHAKVLVCREPFAAGHYHEAMINFWDRLRKPKYVRQETAFGRVRGGRRASPLLLHIAQSQAGHHLVMTAFRSKPEPLGQAGWSLIDEFLEERTAAWNGVYLVGGGVRW